MFFGSRPHSDNGGDERSKFENSMVQSTEEEAAEAGALIKLPVKIKAVSTLRRSKVMMRDMIL